jgi:hypothetical protein
MGIKHLFLTAGLFVAASPLIAIVDKGISDRHSGEPSSTASSEKPPIASSAPVSVVVELFTSEGCSSCPPADALLLKLENEQPIPGVEVLALEEHVDYWNGLGWVDPFSSTELTVRQQHYAEAFGHGGSYTPQMVVDGQEEFVGSRSREARDTIAAAASRARSDITVTRQRSAPNGHGEWTVNVNRLVPASGDIAEVWLAVTETRLHSNVERGENAGEDLRHAAVVRQLSKLGVADGRKEQPFSAVAKLSLRADWKIENLRIVVFIQEKNSRHIVGASSLKVLE